MVPGRTIKACPPFIKGGVSGKRSSCRHGIVICFMKSFCLGVTAGMTRNFGRHFG